LLRWCKSHLCVSKLQWRNAKTLHTSWGDANTTVCQQAAIKEGRNITHKLRRCKCQLCQQAAMRECRNITNLLRWCKCHMCQPAAMQESRNITHSLRLCKCHLCVSQLQCKNAETSHTSWDGANATYLSASCNARMQKHHTRAEVMQMPAMC
jgi:hypothetical protein